VAARPLVTADMPMPAQGTMRGTTTRRVIPPDDGDGRKNLVGAGPDPAPHPRTCTLPLVPRRTACAVLAIGLRTFDRLESEGILVAAQPGRGGRASMYDLTALVPAYLNHERKQAASRAGNGSETPRDRRDRSQAELNELRLARERRELLPRSQVVLEGQSFVKATVAKLRSLPSRMMRAGVLPPSAEPVVVELLREAQEEMARWATELDLVQTSEDGA
jgi:phage terminase Nu1 subunit (DNA packaging protein)